MAVFETVTALTTTGFSTVGYWRELPSARSRACLVLTSLVCTCSTAGGISTASTRRGRTSSAAAPLAPAPHGRGAHAGVGVGLAGSSPTRGCGIFGRSCSCTSRCMLLYRASSRPTGTGSGNRSSSGVRDRYRRSRSASRCRRAPPVRFVGETLGMFLGRSWEFLVVFASAAKLAADGAWMLRFQKGARPPVLEQRPLRLPCACLTEATPRASPTAPARPTRSGRSTRRTPLRARRRDRGSTLVVYYSTAPRSSGPGRSGSRPRTRAADAIESELHARRVRRHRSQQGQAGLSGVGSPARTDRDARRRRCREAHLQVATAPTTVGTISPLLTS